MKRHARYLVFGAVLTCAAAVLFAAQIKRDEEVVFFPTCTADPLMDILGNVRLPVHGWVFEPERDSLKRKALLAALTKSLDLDLNDEEKARFEERARWFLVDAERGKEVRVSVSGGGAVKMNKSAENGHFTGVLRFPENMALEDGWCAYQAVLAPDDKRAFTGMTQIVRGKGYSIISDIDDTLKVSKVTDKKELLRNTFLREYEAVDGMAALYAEWARTGATFHYVSASPWQLYVPLRDFMDAAGFPQGSFHMKSWRMTDQTFFSLFESAEDYKRPIIEDMLKALPRRTFVLVGDSGEKDPEIYGDIARRFPDRVFAIFIRNLDERPMDEARAKAAFADLPEGKWRLFKDAQELREVLLESQRAK